VRDVSERLRDIQEAITRITKYTNQGRDLPNLKISIDEILNLEENS